MPANETAVVLVIDILTEVSENQKRAKSENRRARKHQPSITPAPSKERHHTVRISPIFFIVHHLPTATYLVQVWLVTFGLRRE